MWLDGELLHWNSYQIFLFINTLPKEPSILSRISAVPEDINKLPVVDVIVPFNVAHFSIENSPSSLVTRAKPLSYKNKMLTINIYTIFNLN